MMSPSPRLFSLLRGVGEAAPNNLLQGPGESAGRRGLGSGDMSPIAEMIGLGMRLLAALPGPPKLFENAAFKLGVLEIDWKFPKDDFFLIAIDLVDELPDPLVKEPWR